MDIVSKVTILRVMSEFWVHFLPIAELLKLKGIRKRPQPRARSI